MIDELRLFDTGTSVPVSYGFFTVRFRVSGEQLKILLLVTTEYMNTFDVLINEH